MPRCEIHALRYQVLHVADLSPEAPANDDFASTPPGAGSPRPRPPGSASAPPSPDQGNHTAPTT